MAIHSLFNFGFQQIQYSFFCDYESQMNPDVDLRAAKASHFVFNGIYALQGHYSEWEEPKNFVDLIKTIALPVFGGLTTVVLTNKVIGRSITNNILDFTLHATFFSIKRIFFYSRGYGSRTEWLSKMKMDNGIVSLMIEISENCARFALQHFRDPMFPCHHHYFDTLARSVAKYALVQLANKHDFYSDTWFLRNIVIIAHVNVMMIFLNESLGIKTGIDPFNEIKFYALAAIAFKYIPFERIFFQDR
jgi:hypothetical protein